MFFFVFNEITTINKIQKNAYETTIDFEAILYESKESSYWKMKKRERNKKLFCNFRNPKHKIKLEMEKQEYRHDILV